MRGLSINEAVKRMRGKPGTKVADPGRKGETKPLVVPLTRAVIKTKSVKFKMLGSRLRLYPHHPVPGTHHGESGAGVGAVQRKRRRSKGLVLDLRDDPGGLLIIAPWACLPPSCPRDALVVYTDGARAPDARYA